MTSTPSHLAGNSRREQLTSALVVGGVLVVLGAASGLGIEVNSSAARLPSALPTKAATAHSQQPSATGPTPVNYIGTPGPGNVPVYPGVVVGTSVPSTAAGSSGTPSAGTKSSASSIPTTAAPTWPTLNCPSDVVTALLDVLLGNKGLLSSSGLLKTVLNLLPDLANLLKGVAPSSVLTTDVSNLSDAQTTSMAQACTPVLSGLLGGGS